MAKRRPNQVEIARLAGVSQSVVSHVINNSNAVAISPETRDRVWKVVEEVGYVPNRAAQSLRSMQTRTIVIVIPDITNPYYPEYIRGIQDVLTGADYDLICYNSDGHTHLEQRGLRAAVRAHADGVIGTFFHIGPQEYLQTVGDGIPAVLATQVRVPETHRHMPIDTISIDGVAAGLMITEHLINAGHRRIAILAGRDLTPPRNSRLQGYADALRRHGLDPDESLMFEGEFTESGGYQAMEELLRNSSPPDAVFAVNDLVAIGAIRACREHSITVPDQLAIAGFDNIPMAALCDPPLTTIDQNSQFTGRRSAELLLSRLTGNYEGPSRHEEIPVQLVVRKSA